MATKKLVDIREVKRQATFKQTFEHYGIEVVSAKGDELAIHCPFHQDKTPSLKANDKKGGWKCFGCNVGGNILDFVVRKEGIDTGNANRNAREAALLLAEWFGIASPPEQVPTPDDPKPALPPAQVTEEPARDENAPDPINPPLTFILKDLDPAHPYLTETRGFTTETISTFGAGYHAGKGLMRNRVVVPIHNEAGELVAYLGRWPDPVVPEGEDKYKLPPKFHKSLVLFNLHRAREHASEGLIVCEGPFDVMALWQRGRKNAVAVLGSALSAAQEHLIVTTVGPRGRILIAFDPDDAGRAGMREAAVRLAPKVFVRTVELNNT